MYTHIHSHGCVVQGDRTNTRLQYIRLRLPEEEEVGKKRRAKPVADGVVVRDLLHFLFASDAVDYAHDRLRVQLAFAVFVMSYTGVRPGSISEPSHHSCCNDRLLYEDVKVVVVSMDGQYRICLEMTFRNRKNRRGVER